MYLSIFLGPSAATPAQDGPLIEQCLRQAEQAAAAGFAMVTFGEQHSNGYEPYCNPLLMAARLSGVLGPAWFGTTVIPLPFHSVLRLAEDSSVVDVLLHGRFVLGMSSGLAAIGTSFADFGVPPERKQEVFTTKLDLLQQAYRQRAGSAPLSLQSEWDRETIHGRLMPVPFRDGGPQIAVASNTDATIDDAARRGLALFLGPCPVEEAADKLARHRTGLATAGTARSRAAHLSQLSMVTRQVVVGASEDEAWSVLETMAGTSPLLDRRGDHRSMREMASVPIEEAASDPFPRNIRHIHSWFMAGTPDAVTGQLARYADLGIEHVNTRFMIGVYRPEAVERSYGLFTREVLPSLAPMTFTAPTEAELSPEHRSDADVFAAPLPRVRVQETV